MLQKYLNLWKKHWKIQVPFLVLLILTWLIALKRIDPSEWVMMLTGFTLFWKGWVNSLKTKKK